MSTEIHDAFVNAILADASYVDGLSPGDEGTIVLGGKLALRLTQKLADYVGQNFTVVNQTTDAASGFR